MSLKSLVRELLLASPTYAKATDLDGVGLYVPGEVSMQYLGFPRAVRLAYSTYNNNAESVAKELASSLRFLGVAVLAAGGHARRH